MPVSQPSASDLHFRSTAHFFNRLAQSLEAEPSAPRPCPGMLYRIGSRQMRFVVDPLAAPADAVRLEDTSPRRFTWLPERLIAIFFPSRASVVRADSRLAIRYRGTVERQNALHSRLFDIEARSRASHPLPVAIQPAREEAVRSLRQSVLEDFMPEVRDAMQGIQNLYGTLPPSQAQEEAKGILFPIRKRLETRLYHCSRAGMSAADIDATMNCFGIDSRLARWREISEAQPDLELRQIELSKVKALDTDSRFRQLAIDLDTVPAAVPATEPFNEVALGDMHGNCELLLHSLVQLGLARIRDKKAWKDVQRLLKNTVELPVSAEDYRKYRDLVGKAFTVDSAAAQKKLVLLGDLLADRRHNDLYLLAILDRLHRGGLSYDITISNHDDQFIRYLGANAGVADKAPYTIPGLAIGGEATASLRRLNELMNQDPSLRTELRDMVDRAYFGHLKAVSTTIDGRSLYAHAVVNRSIFADLCDQAGVSVHQSAVAAAAQINAWFRTLLRNPAAYAEAMEQFSAQGLPTALFACCWNVGVGDDRYRDSEGVDYANHPYPTDPRTPHPDVERVVHGHTPRPSERLVRERERLWQAFKVIDRYLQALKAGGAPAIGDLIHFMQTRTSMPAGMRRALCLLMTAAIYEGPIPNAARQALAQCDEAASECLPDRLRGLSDQEKEQRRSALLSSYNRAWSARCEKAGDVANVLDERWFDYALEAIEAQRDGTLANRCHDAVLQQWTSLEESLRQVDAIARHHVAGEAAQHEPPTSGLGSTSLESYVHMLESTFGSLDSDAGMGDERSFTRTVFLA